MASSTQKHRHHPTTAAPPPTPSTQNHSLSTTSDATATADALSLLLHRLPPTLSLPTGISPPPKPSLSPPLPSLSLQNPSSLSSLQHGFFQLTNHSIPPHLARSAESDSLSLLTLPTTPKHLLFPQNWPLGFHHDDDEDETESFCFDSSRIVCSTESTELSLGSLGEFAREMEKVGLEVVDALSCALGFANPLRSDPTRVCPLMWVVSEGSTGDGQVGSGKFYPYVVGLHYQIRCQRYSLLADTGSVSVSPQVDSVLVTLGDIAQVWSNGKTKKVRGRPIPCLENGSKNAHCISMWLLVTLLLETTVSPLLIPRSSTPTDAKDSRVDNEDGGSSNSTYTSESTRAFNSFSFEDYAWRVYHERLLSSKDLLDRYRV